MKGTFLWERSSRQDLKQVRFKALFSDPVLPTNQASFIHPTGPSEAVVSLICIKTSESLLKCRFLGPLAAYWINQYSGACIFISSVGNDAEGPLINTVPEGDCPVLDPTSDLQNRSVELRLDESLKALRSYWANVYCFLAFASTALITEGKEQDTTLFSTYYSAQFNYFYRIMVLAPRGEGGGLERCIEEWN